MPDYNARFAVPAGRGRRPRPAARLPGTGQGPAALAARPGRDLPPLRPLQRLLRPDPRPAHGLLLRATSPTPTTPTTPRGRAARQARPRLPQARPARPGIGILDIGCGWGSLSLYAAETYGAQVVGVTIAEEQKAFIDARIAERGLQDQVEIRLQDYRDVPDGPLRHRSPPSRWASTSARRTTRVYTSGIHGAAQGRRPGADPADVAAPPAPAAARSSRRSSPPTCTCARSARP